MIKQKVQVFAFSVIPFGLALSFWTSFQSKPIAFVPIAFLLVVCSFLFFTQRKKSFLEEALKLQPFACSLFLFAFVLSFLPISMAYLFLLCVMVGYLICAESLLKLKKEMRALKPFYFCFVLGAFFGGSIGFFCSSSIVFLAFFVLSLLCPVFHKKTSIQELWKDVAFPVFLLVFLFASFMIINHQDNFPFLIFESFVMVLIGALPFVCQKSPLRLTLVTLVLMAFGSYVFLTQNPNSVFNSKGEITSFVLS